jgi:amino acid transporter
VLVPVAATHEQIAATIICAVATVLLLRRIDSIGKFSILLWIGVMATLAVVIFSGLPHLRLDAFAFWKASRLDAHPAFFGLGTALIYAVYDYLGYYNICYIGDEVQNPTRTIPRVIVISILTIGVIYLVMNACIISVLPMQQAMTSKTVVGDYLAVTIGARATKAVSVFILWTAFASLFSLMLGYSRILYAAARDGNFFRFFSRLHATEAYPYVSVIFLGVVAAVFCQFELKHVLQGIVSIRAVVPFIAQICGAVILRRRDPDRPRPFKMWLYPLPAIIALGLWSYVVISPEKGLKLGGV